MPLLKGWENICCWESEITYVEEKGFWELELSNWFQDQVLRVEGNDVSLVGCAVKEFKPRIYINKFIPTRMFTPAVAANTTSNVNFTMFVDKCNKSATIALSSVYGAQNFAFSNSVKNMSIYTGTLINNVYKSASITGNGILLLGSAGLEFRNNSIAKTFNLNDSPQKTRFVDYCPSSSGNITRWIFSVVIAFSTQTLHISFDGGYDFSTQVTLTQLVFESSTVGAFIRDVAIQPSFNNLAVLLRDSIGLDRIVIYDLELGTIKNGYNFTSNAIDSGSLGSTPGLLASSNGEVLAYGDNLFYRYVETFNFDSPNGGNSFFALNVNKSATEYISQLALGLYGIFAVLTSSNR